MKKGEVHTAKKHLFNNPYVWILYGPSSLTLFYVFVNIYVYIVDENYTQKISL